MDADNLRAVRSLGATEVAGGSLELALIEPMTSHCRRFSEAEVPDPYYGGDAGFEHVLDLLEDACSGLLATLRPG
jgi:protein-tyrosine phosphatase